LNNRPHRKTSVLVFDKGIYRTPKTLGAFCYFLKSVFPRMHLPSLGFSTRILGQ
ncbi:MAG: hypothetical protein ACI9AH_001634, partial [Oceanospirillaceae bacterium]